MKSRVSYEQDMRKNAADIQHGLYTIDLINASKTPGKLGTRLTMQGPVSAKEYKAILNFMVRLTKMRTRKCR